jgi:hypothetical protein
MSGLPRRQGIAVQRHLKQARTAFIQEQGRWLRVNREADDILPGTAVRVDNLSHVDRAVRPGELQALFSSSFRSDELRSRA